jgi:Protein of unknown function (DUF3048) N-terminal domain/Protein of unknown function (DUF3048) C-terminal domain
MTLVSQRSRTAGVLAAAAVATLAACSGGGKHTAAPTPSVSSSSPSTSPTPTATPLLATLNGRVPGRGQVVVIKVDNSPTARSLQKGFAHAPVVYQEVIEGEATRFAAVFVGKGSPEVGPIRSARDTDIELFAEYGPVVFGFSGANAHVLRHVDASPMIPVPQERYDGAYTLRGRRAEAFNYYTSTSQLIAAARRHGVGVRDVGLRFGAPVAGGTDVRGSTRVTFNGASYVTFDYDAKRHGWRLTQNGRAMALADGTVVAPQNVIVQFVPVVRGRYSDVLGNNSPDTHSIGSGRAVVFRDGQRYDGRWTRANRASGTHFVTSDGTDVALRPGGQTWVLLVPTTTGSVHD